jgi:hypothetical protein
MLKPAQADVSSWAFGGQTPRLVFQAEAPE